MSTIITKDGTEIFYKDWGKRQLSFSGTAGLKTYKGFPHGVPTANADTINADLFSFFKARDSFGACSPVMAPQLPGILFRYELPGGNHEYPRRQSPSHHPA